MQKHDFTFKGICSYVLYWAREEGKTANTGLFESIQLHNIDCNRIKLILKKIMDEGRIIGKKNTLQDETVFVKVKE